MREAPAYVKLPFQLTYNSLLSTGSRCLVFSVNREIVLKCALTPQPHAPLGFTEALFCDESFWSLEREKFIYDILALDPHPNILQSVLVCLEGVFLPRMWAPLLIDRLEQDHPLSSTTTFRWIREILSAMRHLEKHGFTHGALSPHNIFIDENDHVKLFDFGDSARIGQPVSLFNPPYSDAVQEIAGPGTEQFAFGSCMYTILTGGQEPIFQITGTDLDPEKFPETCGLTGGEIIYKCWRKGYASLEHVAADIEKLCTWKPPPLVIRLKLSNRDEDDSATEMSDSTSESETLPDEPSPTPMPVDNVRSMLHDAREYLIANSDDEDVAPAKVMSLTELAPLREFCEGFRANLDSSGYMQRLAWTGGIELGSS
ncbi:serine/threonine protein kinase [Polytolypa hystricis UAMH7299]|uniref:Serine/threonine protein kinase n=1 Tax=Polytolypa hystricis (strain UAMH7299) TaxID=1447883 RepID=A0A2B7Y068_POLH7|nr:serine/threonine protein kinase [Polytolypa hystricis UAMH7299]